MKKWKLLIVLFIFISCSPKDRIMEGDLAFKSVEVFNYYNLDQKNINKWENILDSIRQIKDPSRNDLDLLEYFDNLKKYKVIDSPWVRVMFNDSVKIVYFDEADYKLLKPYVSHDLVNNNRKVTLKMNIEVRDESIYYCKQLLSIKKSKGKTYTSK
ncbi:hypothetical protein AB3G34_08580 [Flavobacterium sp. WC2409]|uniref:Lipoprotein n=1 Tax=Flavobacterium sp. WC2409 TaxID=3234139 RepID=A0AB39VWN8_9FLAO